MTSVNVGRHVGLRRGKYWERAENSDYYCGACGYPVTDHDSFCPECGGAFRESDASDLETENEKLRVVCQAMWVRIVSEYPNGGFPDMGLIEGKLWELGINLSKVKQ